MITPIGNIGKPCYVSSIVNALLGFPETVNETSARLVATGVVALAALFLAVGSGWLLVPLVLGFAARVLTGPTLSPLGQFVTRVATPAIENFTGRPGRTVPGTPKRFAQLIGLTFSAVAALAWFAGAPVVTYVTIAMLAGAAGLEAFAGICLGCIIYNAIWGCADCADISRRSPARATIR